MRRSMLFIMGTVSLLGLALHACGPAVTPGKESATHADERRIEAPTRSSSEGSSVSVPTGRVQIRWFVGLGTGTARDAQEAEKAFVQEFNASQDEIELLLEVSPGGGVYGGADRLRPQIEAGHAPDVVGPMGKLGLSLFPGLWLDLEPLIEGESGALGDLSPSIADSWRIDGRIVGMPTGVNPSVLYYNRDLFDAAGLPYPPHAYGERYADGDAWTIEKMQEVAMRLTLDVDGNDAISSDFSPHRIAQYGYDWRWASGKGMAYLFGAGEVTDVQGNATIPDNWRRAYHWYYEGMWTKHFIPDGPVSRGVFQGNPFVSGKIAMLHSHLWYLTRLVDVPFAWDIAALPSYNGTPSVRWDNSMVGILNTTQHPREAFQVAYALATSLELLAVWGDLPVGEHLRTAYLAELGAKYPGVDWQAAADGLGFLSVPPHGSIMPNHAEAYARFDDLRDSMEYRSNLELDAEIDKLESDLQALFAQAQGPIPSPMPGTELGQRPASP
jgi:multiple sugar transport system substrate-binding protein